MKLHMKFLLALAGAVLLVMAFVGAVYFGLSGWLKWALIMAGALMAMPLWDTFAGTPAPREESKPFQGFEKGNVGDPMQDIWGFNGHADD